MFTSVSDRFVREQTADGNLTHCLACGSFHTEDEDGGSINGWEGIHRCR